MRPFAKVGSGLWASKKFRSGGLNDQHRLFYLYLLTNTHATSVGCYALRMGYMVEDTQMSAKAITEALESLEQVGLIVTCAHEELIYLVGWIEHYQPSSPNHCKKMIYDICPLPGGELKNRVATDLILAMEAKGWTTEIDLLKGCLRPVEDLQKPLRSAAPPNLTSPHPTQQIKQGLPKVNFDTELAPPTINRKALWEEFPQVADAEEFANRLPDQWRAAYQKQFGDDPLWEKLVWVFAHEFWLKYVGMYVGDVPNDGYPDKANWFMCWQHAVDAHWRKAKKMPPKRVVGSGMVETFKRKMKGN